MSSSYHLNKRKQHIDVFFTVHTIVVDTRDVAQYVAANLQLRIILQNTEHFFILEFRSILLSALSEFKYLLSLVDN